MIDSPCYLGMLHYLWEGVGISANPKITSIQHKPFLEYLKYVFGFLTMCHHVYSIPIEA